MAGMQKNKFGMKKMILIDAATHKKLLDQIPSDNEQKPPHYSLTEADKQLASIFEARIHRILTNKDLSDPVKWQLYRNELNNFMLFLHGKNLRPKMIKGRRNTQEPPYHPSTRRLSMRSHRDDGDDDGQFSAIDFKTPDAHNGGIRDDDGSSNLNNSFDATTQTSGSDLTYNPSLSALSEAEMSALSESFGRMGYAEGRVDLSIPQYLQLPPGAGWLRSGIGDKRKRGDESISSLAPMVKRPVHEPIDENDEDNMEAEESNQDGSGARVNEGKINCFSNWQCIR